MALRFNNGRGQQGGQYREQRKYTTMTIGKFYNSETAETKPHSFKALTVNIWKNYLSLAIADGIPPQQQTNDGFMYNYEDQSTVLLNGNQLVLVDHILNTIWNEYERIVVNKEEGTKGEKVPSMAIRHQDNLMIEFGYSHKKYGTDNEDIIGKAFYIMFHYIENEEYLSSVPYAFVDKHEVKNDDNLIFMNYNSENEKSLTLYSDFIQFKNLIHSIVTNGIGTGPFALPDILTNKISDIVSSNNGSSRGNSNNRGSYRNYVNRRMTNNNMNESYGNSSRGRRVSNNNDEQEYTEEANERGTTRGSMRRQSSLDEVDGQLVIEDDE